MRLPERRFPAASELGQWVRERLRTGEWDDWLCSLRACLPRAPPGLLERPLLQFLEWGREAARDLRQQDFLRVLAVALSSFSPDVWGSLLHDSTSPKLLMQRIREEVLKRGLGVVGRVDIPREIWDSCVPDCFVDLAGRKCSGVVPPSDEAVVMMRALPGQGLLFPLPPGAPGPNGGVFAVPKMEEKCSLIVNLVPLNEEMRSRPEKFSLPSVEVLALLAQQGSSFFLPSFNARARCLRPVWDVLSLPGGRGKMNFVCATLTSPIVFGLFSCHASSGVPCASRMERGGCWLSGVRPSAGSTAPSCASACWREW